MNFSKYQKSKNRIKMNLTVLKYKKSKNKMQYFGEEICISYIV